MKERVLVISVVVGATILGCGGGGTSTTTTSSSSPTPAALAATCLPVSGWKATMSKGGDSAVIKHGGFNCGGSPAKVAFFEDSGGGSDTTRSLRAGFRVDSVTVHASKSP
jgi:hypothetical protein